MEMDILAKIAGHARIVMTLYYRKLSPVAINAAMAKAQEQLVARADEQMVAILKNKPYDDLPAWIVGDPVGLQPAIPRALADRNPAGWQRQLGGWCLMGGNTTRSHSSDHKTCGGCFNGGLPINDPGAKYNKRYASVPSEACIEGKCRWSGLIQENKAPLGSGILAGKSRLCGAGAWPRSPRASGKPKVISKFRGYEPER